MGRDRGNGDRFEMGRAGRILASGAAAMLLAAVAILPTAAPPAGAAPSGPAVARFQEWGAVEEQAFVDKINQLRSSLGLAPLAVDVELTGQARLWAQTMKGTGSIFHSSDLAAGISADWEKLGENVGVGGTVDSLFDAFVASPKHYENLVDPSYRFVGIGVVWDGGRMFTTHRFMALMPPAPPTTAPPARRTGATTAPPTEPPTELAATEPPPADPGTTAPAAATPPAPVAPPASPARVALILNTVDDLLR